MALTATATKRVQTDIIDQLKLHKPLAEFRAGCFRANLFYDVVHKETLLVEPEQHLAQFAVECLGGGVQSPAVIKSQSQLGELSGVGIVYCRSREGCDDLAQSLRTLGLQAQAYHAALNDKLRTQIQQQWTRGECRIVVATIAVSVSSLPHSLSIAVWHGRRQGRRALRHSLDAAHVAGRLLSGERTGRPGRPAIVVPHLLQHEGA